MPKGLNKAHLIGNLGAAPQLRQIASSGDSVATFSIATGEKYKDKITGETRETTEWHRINVWGKQAEIANKYLVKGSRVYVEGKIMTRKYTDNSGAERWITEIRAHDFTLLDPPPPQPHASASAVQAATNPDLQDYRRSAPPQRPTAATTAHAAVQAPPGFDDDIPF